MVNERKYLHRDAWMLFSVQIYKLHKTRDMLCCNAEIINQVIKTTKNIVILNVPKKEWKTANTPNDRQTRKHKIHYDWKTAIISWVPQWKCHLPNKSWRSLNISNRKSIQNYTMGRQTKIDDEHPSHLRFLDETTNENARRT